jgi:X-X-X-Leu-X-X-Gly heptad repeat protein
MSARLASFLVVLALVPGCKGMGGLASGLGKVAGGIGRAANGAGRIVGGVGRVTGSALSHAGPALARGVGRAAPVLGRAAVHVLPVVEDVAEGVALAGRAPDGVIEPEYTTSSGGPLIDDHDACNYCPDDLPCDACVGDDGGACHLTPGNAYTRCASTVISPPGG